ncbi:MAG: protein kinase domain-containing protein [Bacillota bacterium]
MYSNKYDLITGKWTHKRYLLIKRLGSGGIGEIYLVQSTDGHIYAMKLSTDMVSITKEYNYLKKFSRSKYIPEVYELDDFEKDGKLYHYFILEYIQGYDLRYALKRNLLSKGAKLKIICILTKILKEINDEGYVYTDLKYENIMIDRRNKSIRLVDMGSVTEIGSTVKEYTPMYDRASWGKGDRLADKSYQVFALAILLVSMLLNRFLDPYEEKLEVSVDKLKKQGIPYNLQDTIKRCLQGKINDCESLYNYVARINIKSDGCNNFIKAALNAAIIMLTMSLLLMGTIFVFR